VDFYLAGGMQAALDIIAIADILKSASLPAIQGTIRAAGVIDERGIEFFWRSGLAREILYAAERYSGIKRIPETD
jgi:hypothetical protein